jgi:4'-phosphopantetheinyl transferase
VTGSSAKKSSASKPLQVLLPGEIHLWLGPAGIYPDSDAFRREILSRYAAVNPADWCFSAGPQGKPRVDAPAPQLEFNLSHSGDWLACAVRKGSSVGVDLEYCNPDRDVLKVGRRYFRDFEVDAMASLPADLRVDRFYDYWTLKEAWIKARGLTIGRELQKSGFLIDGEGSIALECPDDGFPALFWLLDLPRGYRSALCARKEAVGGEKLRVFEVADEGEKRLLEIPLRASSAEAPGVT